MSLGATDRICHRCRRSYPVECFEKFDTCHLCRRSDSARLKEARKSRVAVTPEEKAEDINQEEEDKYEHL